MKKNELRIGNCVLDSQTNIMCNISQINHDGHLRLFCRGGSVGASVDDVQPIPLTEDILIKCGFHKIADNWFTLHYGIEIDYLNGISITIGNDAEMTSVTEKLPHIKYLHQLQNLIFALTQKELECTI